MNRISRCRKQWSRRPDFPVTAPSFMQAVIKGLREEISFAGFRACLIRPNEKIVICPDARI